MKCHPEYLTSVWSPDSLCRIRCWKDCRSKIPRRIGNVPVSSPSRSPLCAPRADELAVYSCDSPEKLCPFCATGNGAYMQCERSEHYRVPRNHPLDDSDDPV